MIYTDLATCTQLERCKDFPVPCPCCRKLTIGIPCFTGQDASEWRLNWWSQCGYCKTTVKAKVDLETGECTSWAEKSDHGLTIEALREALEENAALKQLLAAENVVVVDGVLQ